MSKFDKVFEARGGAAAVDEKEERSSIGKNTAAVKTAKGPAVKAEKTTLEAPPSREQKQRGRPRAKRSDPDFIGFTTYIRRDTHLSVKIALLQEAKGREMSELVEELLAKWIKSK